MARGVADTPFLGPTLAAELRRVAGAPPAPDALEAAETGALGSDMAEPAGSPADGVAIDAARATSALLIVPAGEDWGIARAKVADD
ncbi:MAG TPA: hypothetical protein VFV73_37150, partial [Streptosporangiaceae bacterium]|nr:hypothetical protein [Streptosporangiaceae bacterium]